jgi:HAD superfamily hydrolase (TIGR01484 family)
MAAVSETVDTPAASTASALGMLPLRAWPLAARRGLVGVFTDIDDTLTTHGAITPDALQALAALRAAGLLVIGTTGRPIGWCEVLVKGDASRGQRAWPLDALVAENGGVAWVPTASGWQKVYPQDATTRARNQARMQRIAERIAHEVPGAHESRDSVGRETDLSIDHGEFARLSPAAMAQVVAIMQAEGMHTTVSSIHTHGCFGSFTKWTGACWLLTEHFGRALRDELAHWAFVGDSGNDVAMFAHFSHSIGVANILPAAADLSQRPRYITPSARGAGFAEVVAAILAARQV